MILNRPADPASIPDWQRDLDRRWLALVLLAWAVVAAWFVFDRWTAIRWLSLGDTDDNMRLMQVRAWMAGQDWYDLRQYRLNPPAGFDIHWSRIVDLPIAGLILFFRLFTGPSMAERLACGLAPLLPLSVAMVALAATVRRLVAPLAWPVALMVLVTSASQTMSMFMPERIDHHGWQLAALAVTVAGLCDHRAARGGAMVGLATAFSLTIGLELLPFAAMAGGIIALRWVWSGGPDQEGRDEARRLAVYAATLGGGAAAGFAGFASYANRGLRCDALTPAWLSAVVLAGALLLVLAVVSPRSRGVRLVLAVVAGGIVAGVFAWAFPQCLGRPEQVSPELARNWLNNVREAKPLYKHPFRVAFPIAMLPIAGLAGAIVAARRTRMIGWVAVALFTAFAVGMMFWQARAGPAAQLLAVPGAVALIWALTPRLLHHRLAVVRVLGTAGAFVLVSGLWSGVLATVIGWFPAARATTYQTRVNRATGECMRTSRLLVLNRVPAATMFTFVDLGPRLITVTHHNAIAGPYHRNGDAILDVQHAFGRQPAEARAIMRAHGATMLLVCPDMAESTTYRARNPGGFYDQLAHGRQFDWLTPVPLPRGAPYRLFRIG